MIAEAVIIGGGISGISIAYQLAKHGVKDIVLVERNYLGSGSTFRCATGIRVSFTTEEYIVLQKHCIEIWKQLSRELGFYYEQGGYVWLLTNEKHIKMFRECMRLHHTYNIPTRFLSLDEVKEKIPSINIDGIITTFFDPLAGKADPFSTIHAHAQACLKMKVKILTLTEAKKIIVEDSKVKGVKTNKGVIEAPIAVLAAGHNVQKLAQTANVDLPLRTIQHHMIVTERFQEVFKPLIMDLSTESYLTQTKDGNFIMGAEVGKELNMPRVNFIPRVAKIWIKRFPWLREVYILRCWAGCLAMSPDHSPILGPVDEVDGLYLAVGYSGHGFMMGPIVGKLLAEWITKGKPSIPQAEHLTLRRIKDGKLIFEGATISH